MTTSQSEDGKEQSASRFHKRCGECGFRRRSPGHDEGAHHRRGQIGKTGETIHMSQGRK